MAMDITASRVRRFALAALCAAALPACETSTAKGSEETFATAAASVVTFEPNRLGIVSSDQLPDPCALLGTDVLAEYFPTAVGPTAMDGETYDGVPLLFRTCQWGDTNGPDGAIGVQIGVANSVGRDVVYNRSTAMDPALSVSIGEDGRETMYLGELPTGGGKGSTIFFRTQGYSVLVGHVGPGASLDSVEVLGAAVLAGLGG